MADSYGDESWLDIISGQTSAGEMIRGGGQNVGDDGLAYQILGQIVAEKNPQALAIAQKRIAASKVLVRRKPMDESFDYTVDFGGEAGTYGTAGSSTTLSFIPQRHFQALKSMATDTYTLGGAGLVPGYGTSITQIFIGADSQKVANSGGTLTAFYANSALGNGIKYRTCKAGLTMSVTVRYLQDCTFFFSMFGRTLQ